MKLLIAILFLFTAVAVITDTTGKEDKIYKYKRD
tara:strand:- start:1707 stop:1808 length:102 start_codon:yes stop_codon:yes gene_type:complete